MEKICTSCKIVKPLEDFHRTTWYNPKTRQGSKDGHVWYCKVCTGVRSRKWYNDNHQKTKIQHKAAWLKTRYGLTIEDHQKLLEKVGYHCEICGACLKANKPNIDHCHKTKKIRGILCNRCNQGLGYFQDLTPNLEKAIQYLRERS